jgi:hypothetical protein
LGKWSSQSSRFSDGGLKRVLPLFTSEKLKATLMRFSDKTIQNDAMVV